jgi:hypothetical protein
LHFYNLDDTADPLIMSAVLHALDTTLSAISTSYLPSLANKLLDIFQEFFGFLQSSKMTTAFVLLVEHQINFLLNDTFDTRS